MHNILLMQVPQCFSNGLEEYLGLCLLHPMLWFGQQIIVKRIGAAVLLNQVDLICALNNVD